MPTGGLLGDCTRWCDVGGCGRPAGTPGIGKKPIAISAEVSSEKLRIVWASGGPAVCVDKASLSPAPRPRMESSN